VRRMNASMKIALAGPMPTSLPTRLSPRTNRLNTAIMMIAAAVMIPPVSGWPTVMARRLLFVCTTPVRAADENTWWSMDRPNRIAKVQHWREGLDWATLADAQRLGTPARLEDCDDDAERRARGEEVHQCRGELHEQAAERDRRQQVGQQVDGADEVRHLARQHSE